MDSNLQSSKTYLDVNVNSSILLLGLNCIKNKSINFYF